jgi:hypothetical protein
VNPRQLDRNFVLGLRQMGFNRISFGIQDFNPQVQAAINRIQPEEMLFQGMDWMREAGFESVNVDLIYGSALSNPRHLPRYHPQNHRPGPRSHCRVQLCLCALDEARPEKAYRSGDAALPLQTSWYFPHDH